MKLFGLITSTLEKLERMNSRFRSPDISEMLSSSKNSSCLDLVIAFRSIVSQCSHLFSNRKFLLLLKLSENLY